MGLKSVDTLTVSTIHGPCLVELLLGDITSLKIQDKVDLLIVSAFSNNYSTASKTLIQALNRKLNVSVSKLAHDKELDLRRYYSCWLSKPLPTNIAFSRLACFERHVGSTIYDQIGDMFRGFMPIFNSHDTTVITPLLGTGNQGFGLIPVLNTMVTSACNWMKIGLPLKHLKIVLYASDISCVSQANERCINQFKNLKKSWEKSSNLKNPNDVYISYSITDEKKAELLKSSLEKKKSNVKVFSKKIEVNEEIWPEKIYSFMFGCKCIVIILTNSYLSSKFCQDEFNMALCYRRQAEDLILIPLYTETMENLPPVISNIQYMDCRLKEDESLHQKFDIISVDINKKMLSALLSPKVSQTQNSMKTSSSYDIFVSYPTKNSEEMKVVYEILTKHNKDLKIFYDKMELKTGSDWQESIYRALECSKCCIILIAPAYFESLMCQEEFSIALALSVSHEKVSRMVLVPVCIADVASIPQWFGPLRMIDARGNCLNPVLNQLSPLINKCYKQKTLQQEFSWVISKSSLTNPESSFLENLSVFRQNHLTTNYEHRGKQICPKFKPELYKKTCKILFCFSPQDMKFAAILISILQNYFSDMQVLLFSASIHDRLSLLEEADVIVMFICDDYFKSSKAFEELNIAFNRQRKSKKRILHFVCTEKIPTFLTYFQILPYSVVFSDTCWNSVEIIPALRNIIHLNISELSGIYSYEISQHLALQKLALDIVSSVTTSSPDADENLLNIFELEPEKNLVLPLHECIVPWSKENIDNEDGKEENENIKGKEEDKENNAEKTDEKNKSAYLLKGGNSDLTNSSTTELVENEKLVGKKLTENTTTDEECMSCRAGYGGSNTTIIDATQNCPQEEPEIGGIIALNDQTTSEEEEIHIERLPNEEEHEDKNGNIDENNKNENNVCEEKQVPEKAEDILDNTSNAGSSTKDDNHSSTNVNKNLSPLDAKDFTNPPKSKQNNSKYICKLI
ncbi:hypothetical protein Ahia01_000418700 [Argonauta hians]